MAEGLLRLRLSAPAEGAGTSEALWPPPMGGARSAFFPLANGVTAHEVLRAPLPKASVVGGLCAVFSQIEAPGVIRMGGNVKTVVVGELEGPPSERLDRI